MSFGGPRSKGRGAVRLARYVGDREGARTFGNRQAFLEAAKDRTREGRRASYVHVVVSPESGKGLKDRDFERLAVPFLKDRNGNGCAFYAAIHRDTDYAHVHLAVARDRFEKGELERLKANTRVLIRSRERLRETPWHETERNQENQIIELTRDGEEGRPNAKEVRGHERELEG